MLHTPENSSKKVIVDAQGREIPFVASFDDETQEAEIYITTMGSGGTKLCMIDDLETKEAEGLEFAHKPLKVKVKIPGAKIVSR